jgi:hypothetical protein
MSESVHVDCAPAGDRWTCEVTVGTDPAATRHRVTVDQDLLGRLRPGTEDPTELVRESFAFMLAREPREAILREFDLPVIGRYFPDWEAEIAG